MGSNVEVIIEGSIGEAVFYDFFGVVSNELGYVVVGEVIMLNEAIDGIVSVCLFWVFKDNGDVTIEVDLPQISDILRLLDVLRNQ